MTIWLISDTHFGHANILKFTDASGNRIRPKFDSVKEMDDYICSQWADRVKPQDHIYHLGDVTMGSHLGMIKGLPGHKRLLLGNHDKLKMTEYMAAGFQKITVTRKFDEVICSHYPLHTSSLHGKMIGNIHGHIHEKQLDDPRYLNVSVERTEYAPIPLDDCIKIIKDRLERNLNIQHGVERFKKLCDYLEKH